MASTRVLVAPDKFKGSLTAAEVAGAIARGLAEAGVPTRQLPLADGGDGSVLAAVAAGFRPVTVHLYEGRTAEIAVDEASRTAVVEVANTCGLFTPEVRHAPGARSTVALGEAVRQAVGLGARRVVLALGGSSTTDGGIGFLHALGARFLDESGEHLAPVIWNLARVAVVDVTGLDLGGVDLVLATDVDNPLTGRRGCAVVFGPQKGLSAQDVTRVEGDLRRLVHVASRSAWPRAAELAMAPGAGAAGGLGWAGMLLGGHRTSGATYFLDLLRFNAAVDEATHVITGEGRLDAQTAEGKLPHVVASRAAGRPVIAVTGRCDVPPAAWPSLGLSDVHSVSDIAGRDTSTDPELTRGVLTQIGQDLGEQFQREPERQHGQGVRSLGRGTGLDALQLSETPKQQLTTDSASADAQGRPTGHTVGTTAERPDGAPLKSTHTDGGKALHGSATYRSLNQQRLSRDANVTSRGAEVVSVEHTVRW